MFLVKNGLHLRKKEGKKKKNLKIRESQASEDKFRTIEGITEEGERKNNKRNKKLLGNIYILLLILKDHFANH